MNFYNVSFIACPCETITGKDDTTKTDVTFLQMFTLFPITAEPQNMEKNKKQR